MLDKPLASHAIKQYRSQVFLLFFTSCTSFLSEEPPEKLEKVVPEAVEFKEVQGDAHTAS